MGANGKHRNAGDQVTSLKEALNVYVSGRSGLRFSALMRFAGPLFDLYDVEWRLGDDVDRLSRDREELATMVSVLDAARLLWTFFALDSDDSLAALPDLEDALLGSGAGDDERSNLLVLLSLLEEHWQSFTAEERIRAEDTPGFGLPDFDTLRKEFAATTHRLPRQTGAKYGPDSLDLPEALALFAEPLLEDKALQDDPDLIEERIERAQAYWELANTPADHFDDELQRVIETFADDETGRADIRGEAQRMVRRHRQLFSAEDESNES